MGSTLGSPCKDAGPTVEAPPSWPPRLPKAPPPDTVTVGVGFQQMNFGDTNI